MQKHRSFLALIGAVVVAAGCSSTGPGGTQVSLALASTAATPVASRAPGAFSMAGTEMYVSGTDTLVLTKVDVVLRQIELKPVEVTSCAATPDGCDDFEVGPVVVPVPLGGVSREFSIAVDPGTYDEIEFEFHKLSSGAPADAAVLANRSDMADKSIHAEGTFNGQAFSYDSDLDVEQEFNLMQPLVVDANTTSTNLTIRLGLSDWFRDQAGMLVNPNDGNVGGQYESIIKDNIKQSIDAFEDRDADGDSTDEV